MLHKVSSYDMFIYAYDGRSLVGPETLTITVNGRIVFNTAATPTYFPSYIYTKNIETSKISIHIITFIFLKKYVLSMDGIYESRLVLCLKLNSRTILS